jgi:lysophospholipase L1-like esterase
VSVRRYARTVRHRPSSSRPTIPSLLSAALTAGLFAACTTGGAVPRTSSDALPTGLVGPVAPTVGPEALRYVAMGDPYTFGDGVRQMDRWPNQMVRILRPELDLDLVANLAGRGAASRQVVESQLPALQKLSPQFVSVQVGANDVCVYDEHTTAAYRANMVTILDAVLALVEPDRVIVLTAPDYTLTPAHRVCTGDAAEQAARIQELNGILGQVAAERGIAVVDIAPIADRVAQDRTLIAADGTHPSGKQYAGWADLAAGTVRRLFRSPQPSADAAPKLVAPSGIPTATGSQVDGAPSASAAARSPVLVTSWSG